jgi:hypothetical protein
MASFSKKFVSTFLRDSVNTRSISLVRLFETPLNEVKVVEPNFDTYTAININPYTLEEQLIMYPVVIVHSAPIGCPYTVIDIE